MRPLDERPCGVGGQVDAQDVRAVIVIVLDLEGLDGLLDRLDLDLGPRLDEDSLDRAIPAEGQRARSEHLVERLVQGRLVGLQPRGRVLDDALLIELDEQLTKSLGESRDLGLLDDDADDASRRANLQEEGPIARLADGPGREPIRVFEDVEATGHGSTVPGFDDRAVRRLWIARREGPPSGHPDGDPVVALGAEREGSGVQLGLDLALAIGRADLDGVAAGGCVP